MIAILDYGSGNIRSAQRAFEYSGAEVEITSDYKTALEASGLVIPGVGAFGACMNGLLAVRGDQLIRERMSLGRKIFGICVGMQILFKDSAELYEGRRISGVGVFDESVERLAAPVLPHIGWNSISADPGVRNFDSVKAQQFYFVHSYAVTTPVAKASNIYCEYGSKFVAAIENELITATQFHPEKSGNAGLELIANWSKSL